MRKVLRAVVSRLHGGSQLCHSQGLGLEDEPLQGGIITDAQAHTGPELAGKRIDLGLRRRRPRKRNRVAELPQRVNAGT